MAIGLLGKRLDFLARLLNNTMDARLRGFLMTIRPQFAAALALACYAWGVATVYGEVFPFDQLRAARQFLFGINPPAKPTPPSNVQNPQNTIFAEFAPQSEVVMIGDSLTAIAPWSEIFPGLAIANRGVGGDTTEDILHRMNAILAVRPRHAFLMVGINDILQGRPMDVTLANYIRIVRELAGHGITVTIQSTVECARAQCSGNVEQVRQLNKDLSAFAKQNGYRYVDLNEGMTSPQGGLLPELTWDGTHLNGRGYVAWARKIRPLMLSSR